jgi:hypothetical protein
MIPLLLVARLLDGLSPAPHRPIGRLSAHAGRSDAARAARRARGAGDKRGGDPAHGLVSALTLSSLLWLLMLTMLSLVL